MSQRAHTTEFIFDNGTFFVAHTNSGCVRVGMNGGSSFDLCVDNSLYSCALFADNAELAESVFDSCMDLYA